MRKLSSFTAAVLILFLSQTVVFAATGYVPDHFPTIQAALGRARSGDTIVVRDGVWKGAGNKNLDFNGKDIRLMSENGPTNCIIDCEGSGRGFSFTHSETPKAVVDGFTIRNGFQQSGTFPEGWGAGILCVMSSPTIVNCVISDNICAGAGSGSGAGIACYWFGMPEIRNCLLINNSATWGGAIYCNLFSYAQALNCAMCGNSATGGGAMYIANDSSAYIYDSILWNNSAAYGPELELIWSSGAAVNHCDVAGGAAAAYVDEDSILTWLSENQMTDPLFTAGPLGDFYLSQTAAGQGADSPCVDAGSATAANKELYMFTTRTDHVGDSGAVDIGFHYWPDADLSNISLISPLDGAVLAYPVFSWAADGGRDDVFALEFSFSPSFSKYWSTYEDLHQLIRGNAWLMPSPYWDKIPAGARVYWRVRGADFIHHPLVVIMSGENWSFIKN